MIAQRPDDLRTSRGRSTEERRRIHLTRVQLIRAHPNTPANTMAAAMRSSGLYSQRTYIGDVERFIRITRCALNSFLTERRRCGLCRHFRQLHDGGTCAKKLMAVTATMQVTYCRADGTCWEAPK